MPRHAIFGCALHIHARHLFDPASPPPTLTCLQKLSADYRSVSPGRVAAQTLLLRKLGFLEARAGSDRRQRLLQPTEKMVREDHRWLMAQLAPLGPLGLFHLTEDERATPEFVLAFRFHWAVAPVEAADFLERHPTIAFFVMRDGGFSMLLELLREWQKTGSAQVAFDVMETASAFCVSKSQIWNLLHGAEAQGLLNTEAPAWRQVSLSDRLLADVDAWFTEMTIELAAVATRTRLFWVDHRQKVIRT
ncbi:hypothetical protein [Pleomorphomonas sp. T1.2MG-36]|uniref:hypothetical protein n=1 Tax=Pleomorphomonas sp. T1.2MG-36 TaxID=3041167 RepID=UPI00253FE5E7|nr:hypothetical protein [Pleomorphomonas sp. T1.2MG-36]